MTVQRSETSGQGRIQYHGHLLPITLLGRNDIFQLVEQFLGAADAERRDQYGAAIGQRLFQCRLKTLAAGAAVFVQAVAVGAFQHNHVCGMGCGRWLQQGRMGCAQVSGEDDPAAAFFFWVIDFALHPG